jgi:trehalose 6-phosphate phosphatase
MSPNAVTGAHGDWALFLDVDGTILEIAETPQSVRVPDSLKDLLVKVSLRLEGALALVSGRTLDELDRLFAPLNLCSSGVHGCERRDALGCVVRPPADVGDGDLASARQELARFVMRDPNLLLEDKRYSIALHFRRAPYLSADVYGEVRRVCERLGPRYTIQPGKCVFEIRPAAWTKGRAIADFMSEAPFKGRKPVFVGDDVSDEAGFAAVNALQGISIRVGQMSGAQTAASRGIRDVRHVHRWLEAVGDGVSDPEIPAEQ